ncbi:MAG: sensor histidine kinase [Caldilineaceae bacterium]
MLRTLQSRFALSHLLPVLLVIPLIGLTTIYLVESRYFLDDLAAELVGQGSLIAELIEGDQQLWSDPTAGGQLVARLQPKLHARVMLLDGSGRMLSSSLGEDTTRRGEIIQAPVIAVARNGTVDWQTEYSTGLQDWVVDVAIPVFDGQGKVVGIIRLSHRLSQVRARLSMLRWALVLPFSAGIIIAIMLALFLARSLALPIIQLRNAMSEWDIARPPQPVIAHGPEPISALITQFNGMASRLYELEQGRRQLLAAVVHELGRPIGAIKLTAQYLAQYSADDPTATTEMVGEIDDQAEHLRRLLDDLVLLAQSASGRFDLKMQVADVTPLLHTQLDRVARQIAEKEITLLRSVPPDLPPVSVDPMRFTQIVSNLLDNAGKYTTAGGHITLTAATVLHEGQPQLEIRISDSGPGIAPAEQEKIFHFFYRSPDQAAIQRGMGIGLALAHQLAEAQGGQLTVESSLGAGATFILRFSLRTPLSSPL